MENAEEVFQFLEEFTKRKPKTIPQELNDYLVYVARTGDSIYQWSLVKSLFKEKLLNVITDFHESTPSVEIPPCPNVDPFNYDIMKNSLIERLDTFTSAPFTVQRICELLTCPRKQYNRVDKFMRAIEKNILVVSTREPGLQRNHEPENGEPMEAMVNGSDKNSEYNVDVEMEDMSWKETGESKQDPEPQPSSSDAHISVDDLEARLQAKQDVKDNQERQTTEYESVTPPELNVVENTETIQGEKVVDASMPSVLKTNVSDNTVSEASLDQKIDVEMTEDCTSERILVIPDIKVDDAEMTEQKLQKEALEKTETESKENIDPTMPTITTDIVKSTDESSSDVSTKDETEPKNISEVSSSSEESSSSSENNDGNSNSPKQLSEDARERMEEPAPNIEKKEEDDSTFSTTPSSKETDVITPENYSITDVNSEIQPPIEPVAQEPTQNPEELKEDVKKQELVDVPLNTETPEA
ncbi:serine/threonine-protein phosphatase 4 regulatory subunit 2 [Pieris napi]|uniref:serine/threonine-protein phosphatase 4 regulatory subunit 2 n=1 Tax=Pieris napi TaxID=78633 RepID=UPI001FB94832|nr:serine/threonine-protein phosphatase 4 regulatory subunit 2 [Pieris napi]